MKYFWIIIILMTLSCVKKKKEFIQPKILIKNSGFDLTKLSFNEDVLTLMSKSLDTINNYKNVNYPTDAQKKSLAQNSKAIYLDEKRYYFQLLELDSVAQYFGLMADNIKIETDSTLKIQACWSNAKVFDSTKLDSVLHKMYVHYGKTNWMKNYEAELGLQKVVYANTDENGKITHEIKYEEYEIDYEAYLYEYKINNFDNFDQWNLADRIIQVKISDGVESIINLSSGQIERKPYYSVELLSILKKEYELIKKTLASESTKYNYPMRIVKPYYIEDLDFYLHFNRFYISETKDGKKTYDFNK